MISSMRPGLAREIVGGIVVAALILVTFGSEKLGVPLFVVLFFLIALAATGLGLIRMPGGSDEADSGTTRSRLRTGLSKLLRLTVYLLALVTFWFAFDAILFPSNAGAAVPWVTYLILSLLIAATVLMYLGMLRYTYRNWFFLPPWFLPRIQNLQHRYPVHLRVALAYNSILLVVFALIGIRLIDIDLGLFLWFSVLLTFGVGNLILFAHAVLTQENTREGS
jgi:hypothetical protein